MTTSLPPREPLDLGVGHMITRARRLSASLVHDRLHGHGRWIEHPLVNYTPELLLVGPVLPVSTQGSILPVLQGLARLEPHHILVIEGQGSAPNALLGDIIMSAAKHQGAGGIVCFGTVRDVEDAPRLRLPLWAEGTSPRAAGLGEAIPQLPAQIQVGGVVIRPGDWLFGDRDGLVLVEGEWIRLVVKAAAIKAKKERLFKERLSAGARIDELMNLYGHIERGEPIVVEF